MTTPFDDTEPLEPELWFAALEQLRRQQNMAAGAGMGSLLRQAFHLLQLAPRPLRAAIRCELDEDSFEKLLDTDAFDSAAVALVGPPAGFALRCVVGDRHRLFQASVRLPGQAKAPVAARSQNAARALLAAWTNALLALTQRSIEDLLPHPVPHTRPVELHPKSIEP